MIAKLNNISQYYSLCTAKRVISYLKAIHPTKRNSASFTKQLSWDILRTLQSSL